MTLVVVVDRFNRGHGRAGQLLVTVKHDRHSHIAKILLTMRIVCHLRLNEDWLKYHGLMAIAGGLYQVNCEGRS